MENKNENINLSEIRVSLDGKQILPDSSLIGDVSELVSLRINSVLRESTDGFHADHVNDQVIALVFEKTGFEYNYTSCLCDPMMNSYDTVILSIGDEVMAKLDLILTLLSYCPLENINRLIILSMVI